MQKSQSQKASVSFCGEEPEKTRTGAFMWGLISGIGAVALSAVIFKKPIQKYVHGQDVWINTIKDVAKKAKKVETYSLNDAKTYIKQNHMNVKNAEESFIYKLDKKTKKSCKIDSAEALVIGYHTNSEGIKVTNVIKCNNLDQELIDSLGKSNSAHLSYPKA